MSKDILSQEEIDALLEGLGQEEEETGELPERVIEMAASRAETEGFPAELQSWRGERVPGEEAAAREIALWGEIEITGEAGGRAIYYVETESLPVWETLVEGDEDLDAAELIAYFVDTFTSTAASLSAEENGQLVDMRSLPPDEEGGAEEVIAGTEEWFRLQLEFAASEDETCVLGLLLPEKSLKLFPDGAEEASPAGPGAETAGEEAAPEAPAEVAGPEPDSSADGSRTKKERKKRVQRAELPEFSRARRGADADDGRIDLLLDVPLEISVELGRTTAQVRDVLALGTGSVLELDKQAGDPVDLLVNGKLMARGEVVVVDENFAVRITEVISLQNRLKNLR